MLFFGLLWVAKAAAMDFDIVKHVEEEEKEEEEKERKKDSFIVHNIKEKKNRLREHAPTPLKVKPSPSSPNLFSKRIPIPLLSPLSEGGEMKEEHKEGVEENGNECEGLEAAGGCMEVCVQKGWQHPAVESLPKSGSPAKFIL